MSIYVESFKNRIVKEIKQIQIKKHRWEKKVFIAEGLNFVDEIPESYHVEAFVFSKTFAEKNDIDFYEKKAPVYILKNEIFNSLSDTKTPQGIMAVVGEKRYNPEDIVKRGDFFIVCEEVKDPGNVGTIIRTADAFGAKGVFLTKDCVDLYSGKVLRSTMGSIFHIPIVQGLEKTQIMELLKKYNVSPIGAHLSGKKTPDKLDLKKPCAILIGNETKGLSDEISALCEELVKIPMPGKAESLNASVAAAVLMYETLRQRRL